MILMSSYLGVHFYSTIIVLYDLIIIDLIHLCINLFKFHILFNLFGLQCLLSFSHFIYCIQHVKVTIAKQNYIRLNLHLYH